MERILSKVLTAESRVFAEQPPVAPKSVSGNRKADFRDDAPIPKRTKGRPKKAESVTKTLNHRFAPNIKPGKGIDTFAQGLRQNLDQTHSNTDLLPHWSERLLNLNIREPIRNTRSSSKKPPVNVNPLRRSNRTKQLNCDEKPPSTTSSTEPATVETSRITKQK